MPPIVATETAPCASTGVYFKSELAECLILRAKDGKTARAPQSPALSPTIRFFRNAGVLQFFKDRNEPIRGHPFIDHRSEALQGARALEHLAMRFASTAMRKLEGQERKVI